VGLGKTVIRDFNGVALSVVVQIEMVFATDEGKRSPSKRGAISLGKVAFVGSDNAIFKLLARADSVDFAMRDPFARRQM
jgi:hypothetical protein